jgi:hypothetical protein
LTDCSDTGFGWLETSWKVIFDPLHVAFMFATKKHLPPEITYIHAYIQIVMTVLGVAENVL